MESSSVPGSAGSVRAPAAGDAARMHPLNAQPPRQAAPPLTAPGLSGASPSRWAARRQPPTRVAIGRAMPAVPRNLPLPPVHEAAAQGSAAAPRIPAFLRA
jgi:hypothetical protein